MPKAKTKKSAAKRFKKTGGSVIRRQKAYRRHILSPKSRTRKRHLRQSGAVHKHDERAVKRVLAGGR